MDLITAAVAAKLSGRKVVDAETIKSAVNEYLEDHPVTGIELGDGLKYDKDGRVIVDPDVLDEYVTTETVGSLNDLDTPATNLVEAINQKSSGGGDIILDPNDSDSLIVTSSTLAEIDKSLTLSNHAADAKIVGDAITSLSGDIDDLQEALIGAVESAVAVNEVIG